MLYQVIVSMAANRAVARLDINTRRRISARLAALAENPRPMGCIKLAGMEAYRIRVGDYRIVYEIQDRVLLVTVIDVGHRREVYRRK
jgi:mRNA interferase RelE/StbE